MNTVTINGKSYTVPEITFEEVCRLEEQGIYLLGWDPKDRKMATLLRGLVAWVMNVEPAVASAELNEFFMNGGKIEDIINPITAAMGESGFFGGAKKRQPVQLQDHQRKQNRGKNTNPSQR